MEQMTSMCDMVGQLIQKKEEEKRIEEEQAAKDRYWKIPVCYDDDDDEESSIPLKDIIISGLPSCVAITPVLFIEEPVDSLIMEGEQFFKNRVIRFLMCLDFLDLREGGSTLSVDQESWKNQSDVQNHLVEIQADDHDLLVNSNNKNDDMLGYESEKYSNDEDANETNHAEDADETNHAEDADGTDHSDLKLIENKEIEADEEPPRGIMWLKGRVNKDGEFTDDEIRSVGDKLEADDKIKEVTLNLVDCTDAIDCFVFGKGKGWLC
ncbi:hypothetical protein Tco_1183848 [Tanacetum coccineum]